MYISCHLKTSLKTRKKKKNYFIGNLGMDQLRDMGRIQWCFKHVNYRGAGQYCLLWLTPALLASTLPLATLSMPVLLIPGTVFWTHEAEKYQNTSTPVSYHPPPLSTNEFIVRIVNILYCHLARSIQYLLNDGWDTRVHVCWACTGDNLHEIAKPIIWEKYHHFIIFWISPEW